MDNSITSVQHGHTSINVNKMKIKLEHDQDNNVQVQNGNNAKRNRSDGSKTSDIQQSCATSKDGRIVFRILNQPETQHRARYQTEGSRGAIKDKSGSSFPSVKIEGYNKPAKIQIFIGTDSGKVCPHLFYQVCRVTGKNSGPCEELKINGTDVIEIPTDPINDNTIVCDCIGILKERFADVEQRFPKHKNWKTSKKKSTKCRMVFRTTIENSNGDTEVLTIVSDVINCTQLPGTPEILKMSLSSCSVRGGEELWIIGKNFLKDTKVVFSHQSPGKEEPTWTKTAEPEAEFFHQTHLITKVPPFYNQDLTESVEINVFIKCGDKLSDSVPFTYNLAWAGQQAATNLNTRLPKGVAEPALAINNQFTKTGSVSVITGMGSVKMNGDTTGHNHKNKKSKMDPGNRNSRRTRSVPRPNLIEEDTLFATDQDFKTVTVGGGETTGDPVTMTSFSQTSFSSWKDNPPARNVQENFFGQNFSTSNAMRMRNSLSVSVDEDSRTLTKEDHHHHPDESSFHSPPRVEFSSNLTRDFSGAFDLKAAANDEPPKQRLSFAGALITQTSASQTNKTSVSESAGYLPLTQTPEPVPSIIETQRLKCVKPAEAAHSDSTPSVSVKKSDEEKATISISLPTSILKDQKHFQSVIETINNTLLTKNTEEAEEKEATQTTSNASPGTVWLLDPPEPSSPSRKITSMPVSVLSNTRKRNISSELVSQTPSEATYQPQSGAEPGASGGQTSAESSQAQESKWSAEFNQVLTTMIEAQGTGQMDWAPVSQQKMTPASMDWSCGKTDSGSVTSGPVSSVSGTGQGGSGYLVTSSVPVLSIPEANMGQVVTLVTPSQQQGAGVYLTNSSQSQSPQQIVLASPPAPSLGQTELINNQQQQFEPIAAQQQQQLHVSNQQQLQVNSQQQLQVCSPPQQFQSINSQEQQQFNVQQQPQFESLSGTQQNHYESLQQQQQQQFDSIGSQQQFGQITSQTQLSSEQQQQQQPQQYEQIVNQQQQFQPNESQQQQQQYDTVAKQQQCIAVSSPVSVDEYIQSSSVQNTYSSYDPPSASGSASNPASVEQQSPAANPWVEDMAPIQGDPLLSEASSVIEIHKTIESAGVSSEPQPPEIPRDQQWVNTPQSSDWT